MIEGTVTELVIYVLIGVGLGIGLGYMFALIRERLHDR